MRMKPPTVPANYVNAPSYEDLVNALGKVRHATAPKPDDDGYHEAAHDIADEVLKRVEAGRQHNAQPLACHVCGSVSDQHFHGCGIAEFCPETGRPIPRETEPVPKMEAEQIIDRIIADVLRLRELGWTPKDFANVICSTTPSKIYGMFCSVEPPPPLTEEEKTLLLHTLCGLAHDKPSYRNRYFSQGGTYEVLKTLVARGLMEAYGETEYAPMMHYRATPAGAAAVGKTLPKD